MIKSLKKLFQKYTLLPLAAKAAVIYTFSSLLIKGLSVLTTPLFTRIMSTSEIGVFNNYQSWYSIISVIATLSLSSGTFSVAMKDYSEQRDQYSSSILGLSLVSAVLVGITYFINPSFWNSIFLLDTKLMIVMLLSFALIPAIDYRIIRLRYEYRYRQILFITLLNAFLGTGLSILLVFLAKNNGRTNLAYYRVFGIYSVQCLAGLVFCIFIFKKGKSFFNRTFWKFAIINTTPLIVGTLAKHILEVSDRTMISHMIGMGENGIYSTLYSISALSTIVWTAIENSLLPFSFRCLENEEETRLNSVFKPLLTIYAVVCLLVCLVAPEIVKVLATDEYVSGIIIMPPVACGMFFTALYNSFGDVLLFHKKTYLIMISTVIGAALNVLLNYLFLSKFGYIAAAYTTMICYIAIAVLDYVFMSLIHKKRVFNLRYILLISLLLVGLCLACLALYDNPFKRYIMVTIILVASIICRKKIASFFSFRKSE